MTVRHARGAVAGSDVTANRVAADLQVRKFADLKVGSYTVLIADLKVGSYTSLVGGYASFRPVISKTVRPGTLVTETRAPCRSAIACTIDSPSPLPSAVSGCATRAGSTL